MTTVPTSGPGSPAGPPPPPGSPAPRRRTPWVALVAGLVVAAGVAIALLHRAPAPAPEASGTISADTSDAAIDKALAATPVDSTELKNRWLDEIPGLDASMLTPAQNERLVRVLNSYRCTCGCGFTLATCRAFDQTCPVSGPRVEALRDSVRAGLIPARGLRARPGTAATRGT